MRVSHDTHLAQPFHIHALASDFDLDEVWDYPIEADTRAGETFDSFCDVMDAHAAEVPKGAAGALFRLRDWLGRWFGWDETQAPLPIPGCVETSLRERLPAERRAPIPVGTTGPFPFVPVYRTSNELCLELSNTLVHALLHIGWVDRGGERYQPQLAVYVKTRGLFSRLYMAAILPFRVAVVYPALVRQAARRWELRDRPAALPV